MKDTLIVIIICILGFMLGWFAMDGIKEYVNKQYKQSAEVNIKPVSIIKKDSIPPKDTTIWKLTDADSSIIYREGRTSKIVTHYYSKGD